MNAIKIATAAISGRIYMGRVNKKRDSFLEGKIDVTGDCVNAVCEHVISAGGVTVLSANGTPKYEITVKELEQPK